MLRKIVEILRENMIPSLLIDLKYQDEVVEAAKVRRGVQRHQLYERLIAHAIHDEH